MPFVCGTKNLGEALRRINECASMIRTKGEPGTGDVVQAVRHMRMMQAEIRRPGSMSEDDTYEKDTVNTLPSPIFDVTRTVPPWYLAMSFTIARPSPVPSPEREVSAR